MNQIERVAKALESNLKQCALDRVDVDFFDLAEAAIAAMPKPEEDMTPEDRA